MHTFIKSEDEAPNMRREIVVFLFLLLATLTVYWQVGNYEFVNYDDNAYIIENLHVQQGLTRDSVIWAFTATDVSNWHPLTWLSHLLDFQLYGFDPKGHHLTNVFFHLINTLLLFLVLKWMTGALWRSGLVGRALCSPPPACGVGRLGGRAQGCFKYFVLDAHLVGLY